MPTGMPTWVQIVRHGSCAARLRHVPYVEIHSVRDHPGHLEAVPPVVERAVVPIENRSVRRNFHT